MSEIRVALIEDHDLTRMGLRVALQQKGLDFVGEAATGTQGLRLVQTTHPDVAIVDIGLPDMDGIELTRRLKTDPDPDLKTRILILTMHDSEEAVLAAFAAGADSYCMKDVKSDMLMLAVQETVQGNSWIDPAIAGIVLGQMKYPAPVHPVDLSSPETGAENGIPSAEGQDTLALQAHPLTDRELEVLEMIVAGHSNAAIAAKLYITIGTVKTHVRSILNKLSVDDRTQAAVRALRSGLVSL